MPRMLCRVQPAMMSGSFHCARTVAVLIESSAGSGELIGPHARHYAASLPPEGECSRLGAVPRAADEGPRVVGIGGECESPREAAAHGGESRCHSNEAE